MESVIITVFVVLRIVKGNVNEKLFCHFCWFTIQTTNVQAYVTGTLIRLFTKIILVKDYFID